MQLPCGEGWSKRWSIRVVRAGARGGRAERGPVMESFGGQGQACIPTSGTSCAGPSSRVGNCRLGPSCLLCHSASLGNRRLQKCTRGSHGCQTFRL